MAAIMITVGMLAEDGDADLQRYAEGVIPLLHQAGVQILGRYQGLETLVGDDRFDLVSVMAFPSIQAMKQFLASDDYSAMIPYRNKAFKFIRTFACNPL